MQSAIPELRGFRPTPHRTMVGALASVLLSGMSLSGRHRGTGTTPGETSSRPSKKRGHLGLIAVGAPPRHQLVQPGDARG